MKTPNRLLLVAFFLLSTAILNAQDGRWGPPPSLMLEEIRYSTQGHMKMVLDAFFNELDNNPADQGHVIIYPKSERQRRTIETIVTTHVKWRKYDQARVTLVKGPIYADGIVQFWRVPPGAENPNPVLGKETDGKLEARPDAKPNPLGLGMGRGSGSGDGTVKPVPGNGVSSGPILTAANAPSDVPFRILSKPRASYTQAARDRDVQGSVALRIIFLSDGTIGEIKPLTNLPHGLTDEAVKAAKLIRFQPEIKSGVARTTTRVLTFTFNIY